jgi:hypothetical protein
VAAHGNLLTSFDYILGAFVNAKLDPKTFPALDLPHGTGIMHAQTLLYRSIGHQPAELLDMLFVNEIPVTVNHAQLRRDFYFHWAAVHQCRVSILDR